LFMVSPVFFADMADIIDDVDQPRLTKNIRRTLSMKKVFALILIMIMAATAMVACSRDAVEVTPTLVPATEVPTEAPTETPTEVPAAESTVEATAAAPANTDGMQ